MNNFYISPEFEVLRVEIIEDVITSSPETYKDDVSPTDPFEDPIFDEGDSFDNLFT